MDWGSFYPSFFFFLFLKFNLIFIFDDLNFVNWIFFFLSFFFGANKTESIPSIFISCSSDCVFHSPFMAFNFIVLHARKLVIDNAIWI